jgi:hypothetical protein
MSRTVRIGALALLLEACDQHSHETSLQPIHMVADLPADADLHACLRNYLAASSGYHGSGDLVLTPIEDWITEVAKLPLFDAGFPAAVDTDEDAARRRTIVAAINDLNGADAKVWRLGASDSTGAMLTPTGGLHTYLVFESGAGRLFVDLDWDS